VAELIEIGGQLSGAVVVVVGPVVVGGWVVVGDALVVEVEDPTVGVGVGKVVVGGAAVGAVDGGIVVEVARSARARASVA
jgi:hypothetical protein